MIGFLVENLKRNETVNICLVFCSVLCIRKLSKFLILESFNYFWLKQYRLQPSWVKVKKDKQRKSISIYNVV